MKDPTLEKRVKELEEVLARLECEHRALVELCLRKKFFARAELAALRHEVDAADGELDGKTKRVPHGKE